MLRINALAASAICALLAVSCGKTPTGQTGKSSLLVNAVIDAAGTGAGLAKVHSTSWNRLVISITAPDMDEIRDTETIASGISVQTTTISTLSAGTGRIVCAYTLSANGDTVHYPAFDTVDVVPGQTAVASLSLHPRMGSIMMELTGLDSRIDSISMSFVAGGKTWTIKVKAGTHPYGSLDFIPYGLSGVLTITAYDATGKVITSWTKNPFVLTDTNSTINASFVNTGKLTITTNIYPSGTTMIMGLLSTTDTLVPERKGPDSVLVFSEIMFTSGSGTTSCDYVEIANPCAYPMTFDTLLLDVTTTSTSTKTLTALTIPAHGFVVVGNPNDTAIFRPTVLITGFDLVSTSTVLSLRTKRGVVIDRVLYENDLNNLGWPTISSSAKTAVALDSIPADPLWNNFGEHWHKCTTAIGTSVYFGTPLSAGL